MPRHRVAVIAASLLLLSASACSSQSPPKGKAGSETPSGAPTGGETASEVLSARDFDPGNFTDSTNIDNEWLPLQPGTRWVWEGHAFDGEERIRRLVVITVSDLTKVIDGVRAVVVWDLDYNNDNLEEAEIALFAQDDDGNIWHLGQYPEEYAGAEIVKTPAWIAGLEGARPGIAMKAEPQLGAPSYAQGWGPDVGWNDRAETYRMGEQTCVPVDCYEDVLVTREFSRTEPHAFQLKYYARGVGNIRVGWGGANEEERETMVLVDFVHLGPGALAKVRQKVLEEEERAYELSKVYAGTPRAEPV